MKNILILFILFFIAACGGQSKEELVQEGDRLLNEGNSRGAVVLYKTALEKDTNYLDARFGLATAYLDGGNLDRAEKEFQKILLQDPSRTGLLLKLATIHVQQNLPDQALLDLDNFHSDNDESVESLVLYGRAYGALKDLDSAENLFNKALSLDAEAIEPRINLAKVYLQRQDLARASDILEQVISINGDHVAAYYLLANVKMREGDRVSALRVYDALLQVDAKQFQALYMSGILQMDSGALEDAEQTISELLSSFPNQSEGSRLKGILLYRQERFDDAKVVLENSLQQRPHIQSYFFLGLSYYGLNHYELALNQFQKALDLDPGFERARVLVAMTLLKQKRLDDAILEIQKVLRVSPGNAYAHNILGSALLANGLYDQGMAELERATEIDPGLADAHMKRGLFHLSKGKSSTGEADLLKAVQAAPEVLNSRLMLVTHYLRQKNYSAAIQLLNEGMDDSKSDALLNNYLAAAYFSQKKAGQALKALLKAKETDPDYLTPFFNIASYYASQSKYDLAIAEYQEILDRDTANMRALLSLAALYNVKGEQDAVDRIFDRVEAIGSERGFVTAARHQLKKKNSDKAYAVVERGLLAHKNSSELLELKGFFALQSKNFTDAESAFTKLSGVTPERGSSLLVRLYLLNDQTDKAQELINRLLTSDSDKDYPYLLSASLSSQQGQLSKALLTLENGISSVANPQRLQLQLAHLYERNKDPQKAEQLYQQIIQSSPRFSPAYTSLGFMKEVNGDKGEALDLYKAALKYDNKNVPALNNLAYLLVDNFGEEKEALDYAMRAYRLHPSDPRIMDTLGYILTKNGRAADAVNLLNKAHELLPTVSAISLHLAQAKMAAGDKEDVHDLLEQVMLNGDDSEREQAENLLK